MRILMSLVVILAIGWGCARVSVQAPKEPIRVDISMRLDIYQHIKNDIDEIENMVTGTPASKGPQSFLGLFVKDAYAKEGLGPQVEQAVFNRKDRRPQLIALQVKGIIGENKDGLVELRSQADAEADVIVKAENADRMVIYREIAKKNGSPVQEVQKLYATRLHSDAAVGTPIEVVGQGWIFKK